MDAVSSTFLLRQADAKVAESLRDVSALDAVGVVRESSRNWRSWKPKLVFFFDEAHLLFTDIEPAVEQKIEQMVRLIRSKGVGVYFVSQNPLDIPEVVLGQLGNRVQHALRAFTPRDQKAVKAAAETFRQNPKLKTETCSPSSPSAKRLYPCWMKMAARRLSSARKIVPPRSQVGAITGAAEANHQFIGARGSLRKGY
jgi:Predicted ATPase